MRSSTQKPFYNAITPEAEVISIVREWSDAEKKGYSGARQHAAERIQKYMVQTADGSWTLNSQKVADASETMHTCHGALSEAREKFVNPAGLDGKNNLAILDICSGLGINAAAALEKVLGSDNWVETLNIEIDMVEISWETLAASLLMPSPCESHFYIKKSIETYLINHKLLKFPIEGQEIPANVFINVHCKDAREMVMGIPESKKYDAVFLDPFSPAKSPELYSSEFLLQISSLLKDDGIVLTYTSAAPVRYALIEAGLAVGEGPSMGRSGGTIASPNLEKIPKPLNEDHERMIALTDVGIPFRDPNLTGSGKEISKRRHEERIAARGDYKMASTVKTPIYLARDIDDQRTKRRVLNHLKPFKITDLHSERARFLVCPQYQHCICSCKDKRPEGSSERIKEMEKRLKFITDSNFYR